MKKIQYSVHLRLSTPTDKMSEKRAYPKLQLTGIVDIDELAEHIAEHNSVFSKGTIVGIVTELCTCTRELLLQGYKVQLGSLGSFSPSVSSSGADSLETFTAQHITDMRALFSAGSALQDLRRDAQFEKTSTRAAQAATLAAQMAGQDTVDLTGTGSGTGSEDKKDETGGTSSGGGGGLNE